jgi:hypothetical protein
MLKKFMPIAVTALALALAHSYSPPPAEAVPLRLDAALCPADAGAILVRHHWRFRGRRERPSGVAVFIIRGLYWGPAWWDPAYARVCWKKIRPCRGCAENWIFVC